ncbi:MAG: tetracycline regulation of excision, RteC [Chryseobacterium sp. SCN 40-13]|nr:MAG: tetracycline regulation of excision, RteC [Chryseobacterium sp. SCN 40-13]
MEILLSEILLKIRHQENIFSSHIMQTSDEAYQMTLFLNTMLHNIKADVLKSGFKNEQQEIDFFKNIKPQILGKLIYYNKVFRLETTCPASKGKMYQSFYEKQLKILKTEYEENICNSDFYRYYRSGRTDRDEQYFTLGKINCYDGLNSFVFEIDTKFSTYFDYKVAKIIANELIYNYLTTKLSPEQNPDVLLQQEETKDFFWTQTKNGLIELIYALYAYDAISHGKIGIRKISMVFQILFRVSLNDIHNSFHRMKTRAGSRTLFLDQLKYSLEEYMDREDNP